MHHEFMNDCGSGRLTIKQIENFATQPHLSKAKQEKYFTRLTNILAQQIREKKEKELVYHLKTSQHLTNIILNLY